MNPLTEADFEVLEFARHRWSRLANTGAKDATIRARWVTFGETGFSTRLMEILDHPDAEAYDATLVRRLRRLRDDRMAMRRDPDALMGRRSS